MNDKNSQLACSSAKITNSEHIEEVTDSNVESAMERMQTMTAMKKKQTSDMGRPLCKATNISPSQLHATTVEWIRETSPQGQVM
jgi:hypothetical protein